MPNVVVTSGLLGRGLPDFALAYTTPLADPVEISLTDGADVGEVITPKLVTILIDGATAGDILVAAQQHLALLTDGVLVGDVLLRIYSEALADGGTVGELVVGNQVFTLIDGGAGGDSLLTSMLISIASGAVVQDILTRTYNEALVDGADAGELILGHMHFPLTDGGTVGDQLAVVRRLITVLADGAVGGDTLSAVMKLLALLVDGAKVSGVIEIDGTEYTVWVLNTQTTGVSKYLGYDFDSYAGDYATKSDGVYLLEGADDNGANIDAWMETGLHDFVQELGESGLLGFNLKYNPVVYLGSTTDGSLYLQVSSTNKTGGDTHWYKITGSVLREDMQQFYIGRRQKSKYFKYRVENVDGSDFEIDSFVATLILLPRKI